MQAQSSTRHSFINTIVLGDCVEIMRQIPANSLDFILADPPYLVNYRDRDGRSIQNNANDDWIKAAMVEAYQVLKRWQRSRDVCVCEMTPLTEYRPFPMFGTGLCKYDPRSFTNESGHGARSS